MLAQIAHIADVATLHRRPFVPDARERVTLEPVWSRYHRTVDQQTKTCYRCRQPRAVAEFIRKRNGATYDMCSSCLHAILSAERPTRKARLRHTDTERTCYLCTRVLPVASFTRRSDGTYFSACKDCNTNVFAHRRRARLADADGSFTTAEWDALKRAHDRCPDCGRRWDEIPLPPGRRSPITRDHVVPISKRGRNDIGNIRPLCYSCNSKKGDRPAGPGAG